MCVFKKILLYINLIFLLVKRAGELSVLHKDFVFPLWNKYLLPEFSCAKQHCSLIFAIFLSRHLKIGILFQSLPIPQFVVLIGLSAMIVC